MEYSDAMLIQQIRSGSIPAFERLMRRYQRAVFKVAFGYTKDADNALDVTQNVFLKVYSKLGLLRDRGQFKPWLMRITANESLNLIRSQRKHADCNDFEEDEHAPRPNNQESLVLTREYREMLLHSLSQLSPKYRTAVVLRYFEAMSIREIASALDCSEGTVKNMLFRSLRKLRSMLEGF